jgi:O-antigen/teichoic acid export membrane protein
MHNLLKLLPFRNINVIWMYSFSSVLMSSINIILGPLILKKVGLTNYGAIGLAMFVFSLFFTFVDFGTQTHLISIYSKNDFDRKKRVVNCLFMKFLLLCFAIILFTGYFNYYPHDILVKRLSAVYCFMIIASITHIEWFFISSRNYFILIKGRIIVALIGYAGLIFWLFYLKELWFIPLFLGLAQLGGLVYLYLHSAFIFRLSLTRLISFNDVAKTFTKLMPMAGTQILSYFFIASGILLMVKIHGQSDIVGAYSIAQRIINGLIMLVVPLVLYFIPFTKNDRKISLAKVLMYSVCISIFFVTAGSLIIKIFYHISSVEKYYLGFSLKIYGILSIGVFFLLLRTVYVSAFVYSERYKQNFLIHFIGCLPVLLIYFIPHLYFAPVSIAGLVCIPELIVTSLFILDYYFNNNRALQYKRLT